VRDAERLVQIEVRDVGAELAWSGEPDERIEVGAVDIHLAAVRVHDVADLSDARLEHAVRRRVRHHDRREIVRVRLGLGFEIGNVDIAIAVAGDDNDVHADHLS